ncbi:MAG: KPN_02809 family neutral zinc metallopeptidase [Acidimicrobiales bacterium]
MRWRRGQRSDHVIDRRRATSGGGGLGGGRLPIPIPAGVGAKGGAGVLMVVLLAAVVLGRGACSGGGGGAGYPGLEDIFGPALSPDAAPPEPDQAAADDELEDFMRFVVDDVQGTWEQLFRDDGLTYQPTSLVLFSDAVSTGCGQAPAQVGPFYCPADQLAYIDLSFYRELRDRFGAPGDFAQAYVIAHEIGHHVQNQLGTSDQVRQLQAQDQANANEYSILLELQADCYAGIWGNSTFERGVLDPGDVDEGLAAAAAVGDDRIQEQAGGEVDQETWTHGSSEQRTAAFNRGFESGDPDVCADRTIGPA